MVYFRRKHIHFQWVRCGQASMSFTRIIPYAWICMTVNKIISCKCTKRMQTYVNFSFFICAVVVIIMGTSEFLLWSKPKVHLVKTLLTPFPSHKQFVHTNKLFSMQKYFSHFSKTQISHIKSYMLIIHHISPPQDFFFLVCSDGLKGSWSPTTVETAHYKISYCM